MALGVIYVELVSFPLAQTLRFLSSISIARMMCWMLLEASRGQDKWPTLAFIGDLGFR